MGRRGNLLLVGADGVILDAVRRTPPSRNPTRPVLPHLPYAPPPAQDRWDPRQVSAATLADGAAGHGSTLARYLRDTLAGLSPLASRELAFRGTGDADAGLAAVPWDAVARAAAELFAPLGTHRWQPTVAWHGEAALAYAAYRLEHLTAAGARLETLPAMSAAITAYLERRGSAGDGRGRDPLVAERRALLAPLERAIAQSARRIQALDHQRLAGEQQHQPLVRAGQGILANQWRIGRGQPVVEIDGDQVSLDPTLSAADNAQRYFARYRKAREAMERVPALLETARQQAAHLADLRALVQVADSMAAVRALRREVAAATGSAATGSAAGGAATGGRRRGAPPRPSEDGPYRRVPVGDGWEALVGSSAAGNATVTFGLAQASDVWLHARGVPGAHVILRPAGGRPGGEPPAAALGRAAALAGWHSAARSAGGVDVDYVERRHVRKIPGGPPGLVRYANERTLRVAASAGE